MTELPRVMIGGPVRDREWSVPLWLGGLLGLSYPHDRLTLATLINDSRDLTAEACIYWSRLATCSTQTGGPFGRIRLAERDFGTTVDNNQRRRTRDYHAFAQARDAWIELRSDESWLFQVDSDVQVPATLLTDLLTLAVQHDLKALAAVIDNSHYSGLEWFTNVMQRRDDGSYRHDPDAHERRDGVSPCALTGACWLVHRSIYDAGLRYDVPEVTVYGEDAPFCAALIDRGIVPHYAPALRATHWMKAPEDLAYLSDPHWHRRQAAYHTWRADLEASDAQA